jgi:hypothetical protein
MSDDKVNRLLNCPARNAQMAGLQRLLPVILVTQEAEIRRIVG